MFKLKSTINDCTIYTPSIRTIHFSRVIISRIAKTIFLWLIIGKPSPPVVANKELEINGCVLNFKWSPPLDTRCALTMYIIYYRKIISGGGKTEWLQIPITLLSKTSYLIPLICDTEYEITMSARDETERESGMSNSWRVKTKSPTTGIYLHFCTAHSNFCFKSTS